MTTQILKATKQALQAEERLLKCYKRMVNQTSDPKVRSVLRDMMLMEEMNEVLLKTLNQDAGL